MNWYGTSHCQKNKNFQNWPSMTLSGIINKIAIIIKNNFIWKN